MKRTGPSLGLLNELTAIREQHGLAYGDLYTAIQGCLPRKCTPQLVPFSSVTASLNPWSGYQLVSFLPLCDRLSDESLHSHQCIPPPSRGRLAYASYVALAHWHGGDEPALWHHYVAHTRMGRHRLSNVQNLYKSCCGSVLSR